jgi:hypothetical protein
MAVSGMADAHRFQPQSWTNVLAAVSPALRVASGDTVVTETLDAAGVDAGGRRGPIRRTR